MELTINSKKYGERIVYYDYEDHDLIKEYKWRLVSVKDGKPYAAYSFYDKRTKNSHRVFMHNLIMGQKGIDHIDRDRLNNRRNNLRYATQRQNTKNMTLSVLNKFGVKGVTFNKKKKVYDVYITNDYKHIYIGQFFSLVDAAIKYNEAAIKYHGDFANINILTDEIKEKLKKYDLPPRLWQTKSSNISGYRGVGVISTGKFYARITFNKKGIHLGLFLDKKEAAKAYNVAAIKYYGDAALLNIIK